MVAERVLVAPAELVAHASRGRGFWTDGPDRDAVTAGMFNTVGWFEPRDGVETNEQVRQVIPYLLLRSRAGAYFTYRRLPSGGEERLFDLHSIGWGGHVNDERCAAGLEFGSGVLTPNWIAEGLQRELAEELDLAPGGPLGRLTLHGFLALDETPVDRVHVGVVARLDLAPGAEARCAIRETDRLAPAGWLSPSELAAHSAEVAFEGWSRALIAAGLP
jgi:predicted NUDIX family phosphoesterase